MMIEEVIEYKAANILDLSRGSGSKKFLYISCYPAVVCVVGEKRSSLPRLEANNISPSQGNAGDFLSKEDDVTY